MRGLLLAAGLGTRLRPITDVTPKCLVPIKGKPLLQFWLEQLTDAGVGPLVINTHHLANQVKTFVGQSRFASQIVLSHEPNLLGTAGTLIANLDFLQADGDCMLIHADNYCLANLTEFVRAHKSRPANCVMTMMTFRSKAPSACGIVEVDEAGVMVGFHEKIKNPPGNLANGAVYILASTFLGELRSKYQHLTDFSTEVLPKYLNRAFTYETGARFIDIGTVENLKLANQI